MWIVMDGDKPVRFSKTFNAWVPGSSARLFTRKLVAKQAKREIFSRYCDAANSAPSIESEQFIHWNKRSKQLRIIRVEVSR